MVAAATSPDAPQRLECIDNRRQRPVRQEFHDGRLDALQPLHGVLRGQDHLLQYDLLGRMIEPLGLEPLPVSAPHVVLPG